MDNGLLEDGLKVLGIIPDDSIIKSFEIYLNELKKWSKIYNLTAIKDDKGIIERHFLDSLLFLKVIPDNAATLLDIGSGAGMPGIPLKIVSRNMKIWLIEPRLKKTAFLRNIINKLGLNDVNVIEKRIEDVNDAEIDSKIDICCVRALFNVSDFVRIASPFIKKDGIMILSKGQDYKREFSGTSGFKGSYNIVSSYIPNTNIKRYIISIVKDYAVCSSEVS